MSSLNHTQSARVSSLFKKFLMALTGAVMVAFVFVHMLGNLQMFEGPDAINHYAHFLKTLPMPVFWGFRLILLAAVFVHVWVAILITRENRAARPKNYAEKAIVRATLASRTMGISGSLLLFFIVFHILRFTTRVIFREYQTDLFYTLLDGEVVFNVYQMVVDSFSRLWVFLLYFVCMIGLCLHLSHAVWSMFQTLGWANGRFRPFLKRLALGYAWVIFLGFMAVPLAVSTGFLKPMCEEVVIFVEAEPFDSDSL